MTARQASPSPVSLNEIAPVFDRLLPSRPLAIAVSGGSDSIALMHLLAEWIGGRNGIAGIPLAVVTVDHGLRAGSVAEAAFVADEAGKLGLPHTTLKWQDQKPASGVQAAAREARYRLLARFLADTGCDAVITAHTEDDVAETLLMRLARGSGTDGLAAMNDKSVVHGCVVLRPLLMFSKARLKQTLIARRLGWIEDPSNSNREFERARIRAAAETLADLGLVNERLALSARRLQRAAAATTIVAEELLKTSGGWHGGAYASADFLALASAPAEVAIKTLRQLIDAMRGTSDAPRLSQIEALHAHLFASGRQSSRVAMTLGGVMVDAAATATDSQTRVRVFRETGRGGLPELQIQPGTAALWDNRFEVMVNVAYPDLVTVAALGDVGLSHVRRIAPNISLPVPHPALVTLPAFWSAGELLAVPYFASLDSSLTGPAAESGPLLTATVHRQK